MDSSGLYSGSGADVSIVVEQTKEVVTVPTSAVTTFGTVHSVTVSSGAKVIRKVVITGASDPTVTEVTSGLKLGDRVALAKLNNPVPTSGTALTGRGGTVGGGGLGGGLGRSGGGAFYGGAGTTRG